MRDAIKGEGLNAFRAAVADHRCRFSASPIASCRRPESAFAGFHLHDNAVGVGLPFGHSDSETLSRLIDAARRAGAAGLRTAPGRALLLVGLTAAAARQIVAEAGALGFIVDPADPRRRVVACAGAPICASGEIPARAMAPAIAERRANAARWRIHPSVGLRQRLRPSGACADRGVRPRPAAATCSSMARCRAR